jgi:hypothetical protein
MDEEDNNFLPPLGWRRFSSEARYYWVIWDRTDIVAVVYEIGEVDRGWAFYHLVGNSWVLLMECGPLNPPIEGIDSHFAFVLGYAADLNVTSDCFVVVERGAGYIWWLFYFQLRGGGSLLLFAFRARISDVVHEVRDWSSDESSDEPGHPYASPRVYDI